MVSALSLKQPAAHQSLQGHHAVALSPLLMSDLMSLGKLQHAQQFLDLLSRQYLLHFS